MKKLLALSVLVMALGASCKKSIECTRTPSTLVAPASEVQAVKDYLASKSITASQDPSGVFYVMTEAGTGTETPGLCTTIVFTYKGTLTNGNVFDQSTSTVTYPLGDLIVGWQKIIPMMKRGGKATLYIPPTLGYGPNDVKDNGGNVIIPGNSILIFDIQLVNF